MTIKSVGVNPNCAPAKDGRTTHRTRTVRVGQIDVAAAGAPVWFVAGPVRGDAGSRAGEVLDRMAALGPRFRVGLQPSPYTTRWNFTEKPSVDATPTFDISGRATAQEILDRVVGRPPAAPISVAQAGEHLCICFDHGIGDTRLMMEVLAALLHNRAPNGFVDPLPAPTIDRPVRWAFAHYLKSKPRQVIRHVVGLAARARSSFSAGAQAAARGDDRIAGGVGDATGYRAVFVKSVPHLTDELRTWRDHTHPDASVTGLVMLSIYRALRDAGITLADDCEVLVDLRRFLPDAVQTLSNFVAVTRVNAAAGTSYEKFSAELRSTAESIGTLVKVAAYFASAGALAAVRSRRKQPWRAAAGPAQRSVVSVTISDFSKTQTTAKLAWDRPMDAELAVALPPGSASHLSIAVWIAGNGSVQATATFAAGLLDPDTVRDALRAALTPENLCVPRVSAHSGGGGGLR